MRLPLLIRINNRTVFRTDVTLRFIDDEPKSRSQKVCGFNFPFYGSDIDETFKTGIFIDSDAREAVKEAGNGVLTLHFGSSVDYPVVARPNGNGLRLYTKNNGNTIDIDETPLAELIGEDMWDMVGNYVEALSED